MDEIYGLHSSTDDYADKALMSPENLMYQQYDHYNSLIASGDHRYRIPAFESEEQLGYRFLGISESASTNYVQNQMSRRDHHEDEHDSNLIKAKIASHPSYPKLIEAYIDCQKVGAPPEIACFLEEIRREKDLCNQESVSSMCLGVDPELDEFMETYCDMLVKYKSDLSRPFDEATSFLNKIETQLGNLCTDDGDGAVSSDDDESRGGETDITQETRSNSEEQQLKDRLLRRYGNHIGTLKLEFSKKKKKGKLPKEARQTLLEWWNLHDRWPYPTEADKISLAESTGLDQKQINNWFINQRKRHWKPSENMQLAIMGNLSGHFFAEG